MDRSCDIQLLEAFSWFESNPRAKSALRWAREASLQGTKKDMEKKVDSGPGQANEDIQLKAFFSCRNV